MPSADWKFWMHEGEMSRASEGAKGGFVDARRVLDALARKVTQYEPGKELISGVTPVATSGHTPGHVSLTLASGKDSTLATCDLANRPELFLAHPEWHVMYDMDQAMAEATRRKMFDIAVADRMLAQGFHYPFPANGRIEKAGTGYKVAAAPWATAL